MIRLHRTPPKSWSKYFILCLFVSLIVLSAPERLSLHAQTATKESPTNTNARMAAPSAPATGQAPGDVTKKITDMVNAGKYAEARIQTTSALSGQKR
jgi:hypothetical protein